MIIDITQTKIEREIEILRTLHYHQMLLHLHDKQLISTEFLLSEMGIDYDKEIKRMKQQECNKNAK